MHLGLLVVLTLAAAPPEPSPPPCSDLAKRFCKDLFGPAHRGHWDLSSGDDLGIHIRRGMTSNDFSETLQRSLTLRLQHREGYPALLKQELDRLSYFRELDEHLHAPPVSESDLPEILHRHDHAQLLPAHWNAGLTSAAFRQVLVAHPEAERQSMGRWPLQWLKEQETAREQLMAEANRIAWQDSPEWKETQRVFEEVRAEMKSWLREQGGLSPLQAAAVEVDLDTVQLFPPGTRSPANDGCATVELNASYRDSDNSIELCAGEVLIAPPRNVLAHELAHVLGPRRQTIRRQRQYALAQLFQGLRQDLCAGKPVQCARWHQAQAGIPRLLPEWYRHDPEPLPFYECLQDKPIHWPSDQTLIGEARSRAGDQVQRLASRGVFLALTRTQTVSLEGIHHPNPAYLNPCQALNKFEASPPLAEEVTSVVTFIEEYACADPKLAPQDRLERSIVEMRRAEELYEMSELGANLTFSGDPWLVGQGYAENPSEDAADYVAVQVLKRLVAREPDVEVRRNWFRSAIADGCAETSWATEFPAENAVEAQHNPEVHAPDEVRRVRFFNAAADLLECRPDGSVKACSWGAPRSAQR